MLLGDLTLSSAEWWGHTIVLVAIGIITFWNNRKSANLEKSQEVLSKHVNGMKSELVAAVKGEATEIGRAAGVSAERDRSTEDHAKIIQDAREAALALITVARNEAKSLIDSAKQDALQLFDEARARAATKPPPPIPPDHVPGVPLS